MPSTTIVSAMLLAPSRPARALLQRPRPRATGGGASSPSSTSPLAIALPVVGAVLLLVFMLALLGRDPQRRKRWLDKIWPSISSASSGAAAAREGEAAATPATVEAGISSDNLTEAQRQAAAVRADARRNARAEQLRRQGSQRSVRSLPVYEVELSDREMRLMKPDDGDSDEEGQVAVNRQARWRDEDPSLDPPRSAPLLGNSSPPPPTSELPPMSSRPDASWATGAPPATISITDPPLDEAPAYEDDRVAPIGTALSNLSSLESTTSPERAPRARPPSVISSFLNRVSTSRHGASSVPDTSQPASHPNPASSSSSMSIHSSAHRPSTSISTLHATPSSLSLLLHPTRSRVSTDGGYASSANLSQLSISAPLPDTLIRSSFSHPKAGLSSEQMAFLASTENLVKYASPYGPRTSSERPRRPSTPSDDERPPPGFDEVVLDSPTGREGDAAVMDRSLSGPSAPLASSSSSPP